MSHHHPNPFDHEIRARVVRAAATREMWRAVRQRLFAPDTRAPRG